MLIGCFFKIFKLEQGQTGHLMEEWPLKRNEYSLNY